MYILPGTIIADKFEIISQLGVGGFGAVYSAKQTTLDRVVAVKVIHEHQGFNDDALIRFEREAQVLAKLQHKNLAQLYGYGVWNGAPYMVLEFIKGRSLQTLITQQGKLRELTTISLCKQICDALTCIHTNGLVHRDLKPANVMLVRGTDGADIVKIIDFGLVKVDPGIGERVQRLTEAGSTVGSAEYMSPEQCMGKELDGRSDIYALGCVLQACLTGTAPFVGEHSVVVMQQHLYDPPPQLVDVLPPGTFSADMQLVLNQALAKDAKSRYETAAEFRADLSKISGHDTTRLKASTAGIPAALNINFGSGKRRANIVMVAIASALVSGAGFLYYQMNLENERKNAHGTDGDTALGLFKEGREEEDLSKSSDRLIDLYTRALAADKVTHDLTERDRARAKRWLSFALAKGGKYDEAKPYALTGLDDKMASGETDKIFTGLVAEVVRSCERTHDYKLALEKVKVADDYYLKRLGKPSPTVRMLIAELYAIQGENDKAMELYRVLAQTTAPDHGEYREIMREKARMESRMGIKSEPLPFND